MSNVAFEQEYDPCPMGCGRTTDDVYGGPCSECWDAPAVRSQTAQGCFSLGHDWEHVGGHEGMQCARCGVNRGRGRGAKPMTDRLDLEAVRARVLDRHSALSFRADCIALIAEVERLQEKESEGSWLREQLRRTQAEMDRLRADVARKDEALRQMLRRVPVLAVSASESDRFALTEMATQIALTALSESEEQAVSRSRPERGTEGVGLSGETAHSSDSETSA